MTQTMAERVPQHTNNNDLDSDVQEIAPSLLFHSRHKRRHRRHLREPIDRRFCRCSSRNKKRNEDNASASSSLPSPQEMIQASYNQFLWRTLWILIHFNVWLKQCAPAADPRSRPTKISPSQIAGDQIMSSHPVPHKVFFSIRLLELVCSLINSLLDLMRRLIITPTLNETLYSSVHGIAYQQFFM
jgi:hypothetical protein